VRLVVTVGVMVGVGAGEADTTGSHPLLVVQETLPVTQLNPAVPGSVGEHTDTVVPFVTNIEPVSPLSGHAV